jgi:glycosyltransferase involved in cell wall biosynthesis
MEVIILLTPGFPENENDSTCLPAFQQFALAVKSNFPQLELIIITMHYPFISKEYFWNGMKVIAIGGKNKRHLWNLITRKKTLKVLEEVLKKKFINGLLSLWCTDAALIGNTFSKKYCIPHYIWIIGQDAKKENNLVSKIKPHADQLIAMSDFLKKDFYKNHNILPKYTVENGINETIFPKFNSGERKIDVLGAGSLIPLKNYSLFIDIIHEVRKTIPLIQAVMVGDGKEFDMLQLKIEQLSLKNNISLKGSVSHSATLEFMSQSKVFLHTSKYEGNSTVLMEALYSGCQVISTCPLSEKALDNLFILSTAKEMVTQLISILSDKHNKQPSQITFNTMNDSAKKIVNLFK